MIIAVEILVEGSWETSFCPTSGWETSIPVNHVTPGLGSVDEPGADRDVAKTWVSGLVAYSDRSEAPSPLVAPKISTLVILVEFWNSRDMLQRGTRDLIDFMYISTPLTHEE